MYTEVTSDNGFVTIMLSNSAAKAKIALQGAHIFDYTREGEAPLLWLSPKAVFERGKAIRGGIPLCWPWFGKHPEHSEWPQHGFARTAMWKLENVTEPNDRTSIVTLSLDHAEASKQPYFPYRFRLTLEISVGEILTLSLTTENLDQTPFTITEALHSYFHVGAIDAVTINGLEDVSYTDALDHMHHDASGAPLIVEEEVDRVYTDTEEHVLIRDGSYQRSIVIGKSGSRSTVVWNPWTEKAAAMTDFEDEGYRSMVCIETANALDNSVTIAPGTSHTIRQVIL